MEGKKFYTTTEKAHTHDTVMPLLEAMYSEFKELSKKKPDAAVSKSKIKIVNRLLDKICNVILLDDESIHFLDIIDEDEVPQASDITLILSQYVAAMKSFYGKHYGWNGASHDWFVK